MEFRGWEGRVFDKQMNKGKQPQDSTQIKFKWWWLLGDSGTGAQPKQQWWSLLMTDYWIYYLPHHDCSQKVLRLCLDGKHHHFSGVTRYIRDVTRRRKV